PGADERHPQEISRHQERRACEATGDGRHREHHRRARAEERAGSERAQDEPEDREDDAEEAITEERRDDTCDDEHQRGGKLSRGRQHSEQVSLDGDSQLSALLAAIAGQQYLCASVPLWLSQSLAACETCSARGRYKSRRFSMALVIVTSSAYSRS